ncbi:MAG TPA: hypothetical protein VNV85_01635 [Puia sp.]|jgi:hypothetical protein|nr:hypothetical protein [Puia sp.]
MKRTLTIILLSACFFQLQAQTNNSPYSIFGIGDIEDSYFNRTSGLSNTGIAYRSSRYLINNNPASFSALDNDFFAGEIGGRASLINYYGSNVNPSNNQSFDITFKKVVLGIKASKHWGTSVGLLPFSSQNYEFNSPLNVNGTTGVIANQFFQGSGGLNKVYWANSYEFFHHLSLGVDVSYLFGSLQQKIIIQDPNQIELVSTNNNVNLTNFYFDYGFQFYGKMGKKWDYVIGATLANKSPLNVEISQTVLNPDSSQLYSNTFPLSTFNLPTSIGGGISLTYNKRYTLLADYKYQGWGSVNNTGYINSLLNSTNYMNYSIHNASRMSVGFEMSKKRAVYNTLIETTFYQAGLYYSNSYLNVYGQQIRDIGGSLGIGVNSKRTPLAYTFSIQYGVKGVQSTQLIQERYANFTVSISYRDFWLTKGRKFF